MVDLTKLIGVDERLSVTEHHDIYPTIDLSAAYAAKPLTGKVALITGASSGIGAETASVFARAGASLLLVARTTSNLEAVRDNILRISPGTPVELRTADVRDYAAAAACVEAAIEKFGRLDVLVPNAGATTTLDTLLGEKDPDAFWNTFEVNIRGVYNFLRAAIPHLQKAQGRVIAVGSNAAQLRIPFCADYCTSKLALQRLVELTAMEYPAIKIFVLHPGHIPSTAMGSENYRLAGGEIPKSISIDSIELPAATALYLAEGKADWLNGRFVSTCWDLAEVEREWKEKILASNALVVKLAMP